jgi:hypothetical protein
LLAGLFATGVTRVIEPAQAATTPSECSNIFSSIFAAREARRFGRWATECRIAMLGKQHLESAISPFRATFQALPSGWWQPRVSRLAAADKECRRTRTRTGISDVLVEWAPIFAKLSSIHEEPSGTIHIQGERLTGTVTEGAEIPNLIDRSLFSPSPGNCRGTDDDSRCEGLRVRKRIVSPPLHQT